MKALLLPGQIMLEIVYDIEDPIDLVAVGALASKALFSASPSNRNVTQNTVSAADRVIGRWLVASGYLSSPNPAAPLAVRKKRHGGASLFEDLQSDMGTGVGWCNTGVLDQMRIAHPHYEGVNLIHQVAGIPPDRLGVDFNTFGAVPPPPIINRLTGALNELSSETA